MHRLDELRTLLRPAAGGLYLVSTGRDAQLAVQRHLYGASDEASVMRAFDAAFTRLAAARAVLLGVPSDVGAGFRRGANLAPQEIRRALLAADPAWPERARAIGLVDLGDVFVVPQLLHDSMLSASQLERARRALYPDVLPADRDALPVSPLSIAERALDLIFEENPAVRPFVLGGDHSTAWPVIASLVRARTSRGVPSGTLGIVQPDAHTDLLEERLGVTYCFATWSYHANELLGRGKRLVQLGTRASRRDQAHWESALDVRQFWAAECNRDEAAALEAVDRHLADVGVRDVYFSNDIDGTDASYGDATGTPEPAGLTPTFLLAVIQRLGTRIVAGDVMEVAPGLGSTPEGSAQTLSLAVQYLRATIAASLDVTFQPTPAASH